MLLKARRERKQGRRLKQLLNLLKRREKILENKRRTTRSSFWRNRFGRSYGNVRPTISGWIRITLHPSCSELHSLCNSLATFDLALKTNEQASQCNNNVKLFLVHWARLLLKSINTFPLYWRWLTCICQQSKYFRFAMEKQQWVPFLLLPSYKMLCCPAVGKNVFRYLCKVLDTVSYFNQIWSFSIDFPRIPRNNI